MTGIHSQFWRELLALVIEGTQFTRLRASELRSRHGGGKGEASEPLAGETLATHPEEGSVGDEGGESKGSDVIVE